MGEFRMPSLGADMTEGTLLEWLVQPGEAVHRGQIIAVVDTAKSAIDVEVFEDGEVETLLVEPGTKVAVGAPLAHLRPLGGVAPAAAPEEKPLAVVAGAKVGQAPAQLGAAAETMVVSPVIRHLAHEQGVDLATVHGTGPNGSVTREDVLAAVSPPVEPAPTTAVPAKERATPLMAPASGPVSRRSRVSPVARRRAAELGVDLTHVHGTGSGGAITLADVEAASGGVSASAVTEHADVAAAPVKPGSNGEAVEGMSAAERAAAMRQAIAAAMARSKREIPHYYLQQTIDLDRSLTWLEELNADRPVADRILPAALLLKAAAVTLRAVPDLNGLFVDGQFRRSESIHLGVAVALRGGGLVAPALLDADQLTIPELMSALKDLVARTRSGKLRSSELSAPTVTVTNLGDQGVELVHGVIYPPQVALVGFGRIVERPWSVDGMLTVRRITVATLAADHRVTDGHVGARYLAALDAALQHPEEL